MSLKKVKKIHPALRDDIGDLITRRALPTPSLGMLDPFLFLNHHGPQVYSKNNRGLPFGPHPHRGFETVTFILAGELAHKDSAGHESIISAGGVQWMTAGRGLVHAEISPEEFKKQGGPLEILQLWVNLPARLKMTTPAYKGLQKNEIPEYSGPDGGAKVALVSGHWEGHKGPIQPLVDITTMTVRLNAQADWSFSVPHNHEVFYYVISGDVHVNECAPKAFELVQFEKADGVIRTHALTNAALLICHAAPFHEPVVAHGPFVMNTREEIHQAILDYQAGKFETE